MEQEKRNYIKEYKDLYQPGKKPALVEVPAIPFLMVEGAGDPNEEGGEYQQAVALLYSFCFTIKMSKMGSALLPGYFDYVMPPLEGLWWMGDLHGVDYSNKSAFQWISMIRQPEFVTPEIIDWAREQVRKKKPDLPVEKVRFDTMTEGLCGQIMHHGPYDEEPATVAILEDFIATQGCKTDIGAKGEDEKTRCHHEIYLGDPRKTSPEKMRTILRIPVRRV